jgi:hypothetical protein
MILTPTITVVVHPIDTAAHPSTPPGWRWAVQVGGSQPDDVEHCANAGWAPTLQEAQMQGEACGATACKAARMFGIPAEFVLATLDHDPIPAGRDQINFL